MTNRLTLLTIPFNLQKLQRKREEATSKERAAQRLEGEVRNAKDREKLVQEVRFPPSSSAQSRSQTTDQTTCIFVTPDQLPRPAHPLCLLRQSARALQRPPNPTKGCSRRDEALRGRHTASRDPQRVNLAFCCRLEDSWLSSICFRSSSVRSGKLAKTSSPTSRRHRHR